MKRQKFNVDGREISVSNLEKVLYPAAGFTKAHVIDFYVRVASYLLPHLKDRPVTMKRYPDGVDAKHFYEKDAPRYTAKLMFIGRVKNGFTPALRKQVFRRVQTLETGDCPFANLPEPKGARRGESLTADAMKNYRWVKPKLVAQVEYTDWTAANHLRHSKFAGLRDDKDPREVVREEPAA